MTRKLRNQTIWAVALGVALTPAGAFAQQATAGQQVGQAVDRYVVGQAQPEVAPGSTLLPLTLEQAMELALEKNLDLKAARFNPINIDYQLQSARSAFLPRYSSTRRRVLPM
jgi:outer membrane protein TolC